MDEYLEYDSYTQVYSADVDKKMNKFDFFEVIFNLFVEVSGQRFFPTLNQAKFCKILPIFKKMNQKMKMNKFFLDTMFKKIIQFHD